MIEVLYDHISDFRKNDWRMVTMVFTNSQKVIDDRYVKVADMIRSVYPDISPVEASYLVKNRIESIPECPQCGNKIGFRTDPKHYYPAYCSMSCRSHHRNNISESIVIDGIMYRDFPSAILAIGLTRLEIRNRIFDIEYPEYTWNCDDHDQKCIDKLYAYNPILTDNQRLLEWKDSGDTQQKFCIDNNISDINCFRNALRFFGIDTTYDQVSMETREFLNNQELFVSEFNINSMEKLSDMYGCSTGTIKNYALKYGLDTGKWKNGRSLSEDKMYEFICTLCPDAVQSYRGFFGSNGYELDIYIPHLNIGIEFNGVYTHCDRNKSRDYHRVKHLAFRERGVRYVQIWEDDWLHRNDKVKRFLSNVVGSNNERIGARKTGLREITQQEFNVFMDENHMQGKTSAKYRIGLFVDGVLLSAMGFKEIPHNVTSYSDGVGIDLCRYANTNVTGAFDKMFKYFTTRYRYDYVLSYADLEIVSPFKNIYTINGFSYVKEIKEDYRYYNRKTKIREHKFNWRKKSFTRLGIDITDKTEFQLADEYGLLRCYDSGKILYIKHI